MLFPSSDEVARVAADALESVTQALKKCRKEREAEHEELVAEREKVHALRADLVAVIGLAHACYGLDGFYHRLDVLLASGVAQRLLPWPARETIG